MPIRPELRWFYPIDWPLISAAIRFGRAKGRCERCARPHGGLIRQLADGRWYDDTAGCWRDDRGREAPWPDIVEYTRVRIWRVILAAAHLDHDPGNCRPRNLRALCQRCHLHQDRLEHLRRRRLKYLRRRALGDLFAGPYPTVPPLGRLSLNETDQGWHLRSDDPSPLTAPLREIAGRAAAHEARSWGSDQHELSTTKDIEHGRAASVGADDRRSRKAPGATARDPSPDVPATLAASDSERRGRHRGDRGGAAAPPIDQSRAIGSARPSLSG